ncbi:MAG: Rpn family recombination-promoting nuclease/putative transposase [Ktedonobacterales bacterium]
MAPKPNYDQPLKRLLLRAHDGFLALIAPDLTWRGELSPELPATARQADLVWDVEMPDGQRGTLHVELQTKPDAAIGLRMAGYTIRLLERDEERPVRSVVVFLRPFNSLPTSPYIMRWGAKPYLIADFDVVRLWEIPQERVLDANTYQLWPLAALMANVTVESTQAVAERIAATPLERAERSELVGLLAALAGIRLLREALSNALRRNGMLDDLLRESTVVNEWIEEGMQQGMQQGARTTILRVFEGRFGAIDAALATAIQGASEATLTEIALHAGTDTLDQLRARLGLS